MANDFDLNSNYKGKNGQRPARRDVIPFNRVRRDIDDFRPIDSMKAETRASSAGILATEFGRRRPHNPAGDRYFMWAVYRRKL